MFNKKKNKTKFTALEIAGMVNTALLATGLIAKIFKKKSKNDTNDTKEDEEVKPEPKAEAEAKKDNNDVYPDATK